jgi:hypothetical protein
MLDDKTIVKVTNRDNGHVGYIIPDLNNLRRDFAPGETKNVTFEEMKKLSYQPGGKKLINDFLLIEDEGAVAEILGNVEPEYYYTAEEVKELLLNGSLDALKDCIDYSPEGVKDLIKKYAVELEINDIKKREAIKSMMGFDVTSAIMVNQETAEPETAEEKARRVSPLNEKKAQPEPVATGRRVSTPIIIKK